MLSNIGGAASETIHDLCSLFDKAGIRHNGTNPVTGQTEYLGETIEMDKVRSSPARIGKRVVWRPMVGWQEIAVGLIDHQCDTMLVRNIKKLGDSLAGVYGARGIVGRHQNYRTRVVL